ncbi:ATP-binding protein [Streptomyces sp. TLI_171]|uniref:ATP-binding protein n=1 Tax=Streptomyces sp. TLI_171 TaxID=1938859 RepID=UPI000C193D85|nr:ATP-binding protein [Streptomyces sp. TLI_171]RKE20739.1 histidine kinase-like protein [Streptomyces sp. TLI_171]
MSRSPAQLSLLTLDSSPEAVAGARRHTTQVLRCWRARVELSDAARLVVSELATNALRARPDRAGFTLSLALSGESLLVQVGDHDPRPPRPRTAAPDATGGRGLLLVGELSTRWGYYPTTPDGKVVWAELLAEHDTPATTRVDATQPLLPASPPPAAPR